MASDNGGQRWCSNVTEDAADLSKKLHPANCLCYYVDMKKSREAGEANPFLIATIFLGVAAVALGIAFGWAYMQYTDYKDNSDQKANVAAEEARETQSAEDAKKYLEEAKKPTLNYKAPSDWGAVSFEYPKTWATYNDRDGTSGTSNNAYSTYFYPKTVPPINNKTAFALRLLIENKAYETVLRTYDSKVKKGDLKVVPITIGKTDDFKGYTGVRINGLFDEGITGSAVLFKIRDKTLTMRTDSQDFMHDFDNTVLPSLKFEP